MDYLTLFIVILIGIIVIKLVGKVLKVIVGISLICLIIYVVASQLDPTIGTIL